MTTGSGVQTEIRTERGRREIENAAQRRYFESVERPRIAVDETPYVLRHVGEMVTGAGLEPGSRILEVGSGLGKFTFPLAALGYSVVANDLSPVLLERLSVASGGRIETACGDIRDLAGVAPGRFDRVIGFFVLHHLTDFDRVFSAISSCLAPGGRVAFCEPVAANPLYYLQIALTPGMRFSGEPSITAMRPGVILPSMSRAGLVDLSCRPYGFFPPAVRNRPWGGPLERRLESLPWFPFPRAFQIFSGKLPE